ncbi:ABC transporter permease [Candidatus Poriferisodalis sp.]|uniref:ABC transporter permease n=1 Tax=Candidatus Poriferisodalis sp. TaxID=3101277 RepID=UPI003B5295CA
MEPFDALWLAATIRLAIPLLLAATGELISERSGVLNLGLEGMMLSGAFVGYWAAEGSGSITAGILAAVLAGAFGGLLMAAVAIGLRGDQVVVGIGLNILALGATNYALERAFPGGSLPIDRLDPIAIPVLSEIPWIGGALFEQNLLGYVAFGLIGVVALMLGRTGLGLGIRATGQNPSAASAAGVSPLRTQWVSTTIAGAFAGLAGAYLSIGSVGVFREAMTSGRGFIAIAILVFGRWRPAGVLVGALLFGAADALQLRLQAESAVPASVWMLIGIIAALLFWRSLRRTEVVGLRTLGPLAAVFVASLVLLVVRPEVSIPSQILLAAQYVVALVALLASRRETNMPRFLATPVPRN